MAAETKTPREWAVGKGLFKAGRFDFDETIVDWRWAASDALYGWSQHAYDFQGPEHALRLTEADFDAALVAAAGYPATAPHAPALAPSYQSRFPELFRSRPAPEPAPESSPAESSEET